MDEQSQSEGDAHYVFVKLANGDNLMCTTFSDITKIQNLQFLEVIDPIQIFSFRLPHNGTIIEKFIIQAWAPFSSASKTMIPINNIVFLGHLKEYFIERYVDYITDPNSQQLLEETGPDEMEGDDDDDEISDDMIEEIMHNNENIKKWYH